MKLTKHQSKVKKIIKNKEVFIVVAILLVQILAECAHLGFDGDVRRGIFWTNYRLFHIGFMPAYLMYRLFKTREGKYLSSVLIVYSFIALLMEEYAIFIDDKIIIELNQYWYSEFILILISLTLCYVVIKYKNGFGLRSIFTNWFLYISNLLQGRSKS